MSCAIDKQEGVISLLSQGSEFSLDAIDCRMDLVDIDVLQFHDVFVLNSEAPCDLSRMHCINFGCRKVLKAWINQSSQRVVLLMDDQRLTGRNIQAVCHLKPGQM